jgi:molybdopterin-guanine dinucleotide biosynthesis protein A
LLDHSLVLYGSGMSDGNSHNHDPLPVLLAGGASGRLEGNRHLVQAEHTPMSNLLVALLGKLGCPEEHFADSNSVLAI